VRRERSDAWRRRRRREGEESEQEEEGCMSERVRVKVRVRVRVREEGEREGKRMRMNDSGKDRGRERKSEGGREGCEGRTVSSLFNFSRTLSMMISSLRETMHAIRPAPGIFQVERFAGRMTRLEITTKGSPPSQRQEVCFGGGIQDAHLPSRGMTPIKVSGLNCQSAVSGEIMSRFPIISSSLENIPFDFTSWLSSPPSRCFLRCFAAAKIEAAIA
jgi:hypothetical protein